ncbi:transcriptional regulator [Janthinobacterium sp. BJB1]|nr:helix-turn-helix domain-containing protein [Janthinobacterium sp. GW458P]PJC98228.1 transcriptional regulator [Janthinobacterium sp. BJB1]
MNACHTLLSLRATTHSPASTCAKCSSRIRCLPSGLDERAITQLDKIIGKRRWIERNHLLFRVGETFQNLYIIHCGQFKTFQDNMRGKQYVTGFHMAGELLGMSAISSGFQDNNAMALEDSEVCEVPFLHLQELCAEVPILQQHFHRMLSDEINREQRIMRFLGSRAEQRFAIFLLDLSARYAARGYSSSHFQVLMSREDIGNHMGLTMESISRLMSKFRKNGWIDTDGKNLRICDYGAIETIANDDDIEAQDIATTLSRKAKARQPLSSKATANH